MSQPIPITLADLQLALGQVLWAPEDVTYDDVINKTWDLLVVNYEKAQLGQEQP